MDGHRLSEDDLMVNAKKIHGLTIKGYNVEADKANKLTPLLKE